MPTGDHRGDADPDRIRRPEQRHDALQASRDNQDERHDNAHRDGGMPTRKRVEWRRHTAIHIELGSPEQLELEDLGRHNRPGNNERNNARQPNIASNKCHAQHYRHKDGERGDADRPEQSLCGLP